MPTHNTGKPVYNEDVSFVEDFDPYSAIFDWAPSGLDIATGVMYNESNSYRVRVGTVVTNYDELNKAIIGYSGANYKPHQNVEKECAELTAQAAAMKRRDRVEGMKGTLMPILFEVVSSATNREIESVVGVTLPTLPPCETCRNNLLPLDSVVITQKVPKYRSKRTSDNTFVEVHTGLEVLAIGDPHRFPVKTRAKEIEKIYPTRILEFPTPINFEFAKREYQEMAEAYVDLSEDRSRMLRAQLAVTALANNLSEDR